MSPAPERTAQDPWLGVEVRHLAALRAVASEGSFGAAALRLGYAQSAISQQVAALERHVGRRLFDRPGGSRPVKLTRAGELLLEHADSILSRLSAARIDLESLDADDVGQALRIGAPPGVSATIMPLILKNLGAPAGEVEFHIRQANDREELLGLLATGELDLAFAELPVPDGPLEATALFDDPYVLVVHVEHPYAELGRSVSLEELGEIPLVAVSGTTGETRLTTLGATRGIAPRVVHRVEDTGAALGYVAAGLGSAVLPRLAAATEGRPITLVAIDPILASRTLAIAWHRDRLRTCTAGLFVDLAMEAAEQLAVRA